MKEYIINKLKESPIIEDPFDHLIIDELLPPDFYRPLAEEFNSFDLNKLNLHHLCENRRELASVLNEATENTVEGLLKTSLTPNFSLLPKSGALQKFFSFLHKEEEALFSILNSKFESSPTRYHVRSASPKDRYVHSMMIKDYQNYQIEPHPDMYKNIFTFLFYCPLTEVNSQFGTTLYAEGGNQKRGVRYVINEEKETLAGAWNKLSQNITPSTTAAFLPNRAVIFAANEKSWHGVDPLPSSLQGSRNCIQSFFMRGAKDWKKI